MQHTQAKADSFNPGRKNIYCCHTCGGHVVTRDKDVGVTPFTIRCHSYVTPGCPGTMYSSMYRVFDPEDKLWPQFEWYKPGLAQILTPHQMEHVRQGGLLIRPTPPQRGTTDAQETPAGHERPPEPADASRAPESGQDGAPESPTGRIVNREPNLQGIPIRTDEGSEIRKALFDKSPKKGN